MQSPLVVNGGFVSSYLTNVQQIRINVNKKQKKEAKVSIKKLSNFGIKSKIF